MQKNLKYIWQLFSHSVSTQMKIQTHRYNSAQNDCGQETSSSSWHGLSFQRLPHLLLANNNNNNNNINNNNSNEQCYNNYNNNKVRWPTLTSLVLARRSELR